VDAYTAAGNLGLEGYNTAAGAVAQGGDTAFNGTDVATGVQAGGRDALASSKNAELAVRDLEQRGGMASEDYLTDAYASALGQISAANAANGQKNAAIIKGSADGVSTFLSGLGEDK
jgi:hypothetical protein